MSRPHKEWHSRGYLPHFDHPNLVQSITFRLADSLPMEKLKQWQKELNLSDAGARASCPHSSPEKIEYHHRIEEWLNLGHGSCHLRTAPIAQVVEDALLFFDGKRYRLLSWVVMPNHIHVMVEIRPGHRLGDVVHSWKSFTASQANILLKWKGRFWQEEYFDRYIRNADHLGDVRRYIEQNPVKAGLVKQANEWPFGSAYRTRNTEP